MKKNNDFRQAKRNLKPVISFVVDGKCELWYLQKMEEKVRGKKNVNFSFNPKLPQNKKLKDQHILVKELSKTSEKVFWIIDFDTILKETRETKKGNKTLLQEFQELYDRCKKSKNITIIVNNPCLEFWFLQHFEATSKHFETYEQLEKSLKKYLPDYEKTEKYYKNSRKNIYQKLYEYLPTAIENTENKQFVFENIQEGITEMYKIFKELDL
ncbi:MAG: RloB family protein [Bacteroidales bacterium]|nr:RloB family protein [Bacteroidales bacterium]